MSTQPDLDFRHYAIDATMDYVSVSRTGRSTTDWRVVPSLHLPQSAFGLNRLYQHQKIYHCVMVRRQVAVIAAVGGKNAPSVIALRGA
jgi:hypothetical protein